MRARGGRIVLTDFGAARLTRAGVTPRHPVQATPLYMAPEVLLGAQPTVQSDLYSLGVLLYFLVSGEFPVVADSLEELKHAHASNRKRFLRDIRPDLPSSFVLVVDTAMAPRPEDVQRAPERWRRSSSALPAPVRRHGPRRLAHPRACGKTWRRSSCRPLPT